MRRPQGPRGSVRLSPMSSNPAATDHGPSLSIYLWLATIPLIWGTHFVALKIVFEDYSVFGMLSLRYALMSVALLLVLWISERDMRFAWRDVPYLLVFTLFMVVIYQIVFAIAIKKASAAESALLISTAPIYTAITAAALRWEKITRELIAGVALGVAGLVLVIYGGGFEPARATQLSGCLLMVLAAVMWAMYAVLAKPLLAKYSPLKVTAYCQSLGAVALIPIGLPDALSVTPRVLSQLSDPATANHAFWVIFGVLFYALVSGAYAFTVWYRGVRILGSARTMLFQLCVPVVGLVAAIVFRHELPAPLQWVGALLTLGGVFFAARRPQRGNPAADETVERNEACDATDAAS